MKYFVVPDDLLDGAVRPISIIRYETQKPAINTKVLFTRHVISFLIQGSKQIVFPTTTGEVLHQVVFIPRSNCLMTERTTLGSDTYQALLIFFDDDSLQEIFYKYHNLLPDKPFAGAKPYSTLEQDRFLLHYRDTLVKLAGSGSRIFSDEMCRLKLEELILYVLQHYPQALAPFLNQHKQNSQLSFKAVIEANVFSGLTTEELAFLCHMSVSTFKRKFQALYHTSLQKWRIKQKMAYAEALMKQGYKPSQIYHRIGYKTVANFLAAYKRYHHFSKIEN